jgi:4-hydroxybenzoate polyprenyltransferase
MKPYPEVAKILRFTKIEHTAFSLPLIFTGAYLGAGQRFPSLGVLLLITLAALGARVFGMAFNRIFDRHIDAANPRTAQRELPSGQITVSRAVAVALTGLLIYLVACALLGPLCLKLSWIPIGPLLGYSLLKRFTPLCHFGIGLCMALAPLGAFVATAGHLHFTLPSILFALFVFFWLSGADIIYALMDMDSDRRSGVHSLPAHLGATSAMQVAAMVHTLALVGLVLILMIGKGGALAWFSVGLAASIFTLMYVPAIPVGVRFFPISTLAGIVGALVPILAQIH